MAQTSRASDDDDDGTHEEDEVGGATDHELPGPERLAAREHDVDEPAGGEGKHHREEVQGSSSQLVNSTPKVTGTVL